MKAIVDLKQGPRVHILKTWPVFFQAILDKRKTFELRKNDRDFCDGDVLALFEWDPDKEVFTGRTLNVVVQYFMGHSLFGGLKEGFCIMGLGPPFNIRMVK